MSEEVVADQMLEEVGIGSDEVKVNDIDVEEAATDRVDSSEKIASDMTHNERMSKKEAILEKLKDILDGADDVMLSNMSIRSVREDLTKMFGDEVLEYRDKIKKVITERLLLRGAVRDTTRDIRDDISNEKEDNNDESSDVEDDDENEYDEHPDVAALPDEWKAEFETVVWVKTHKQYPWWPAIIYNPSDISKKLLANALKCLGKKHVVYYYGSKDWDHATPKQIKPFQENLQEYGSQKVPKRYQASFTEGIELAMRDISLPKSERASWNHKQRKRPVKKSNPKKVKEKDESQPIKKAKQKSKGKRSDSKKTVPKATTKTVVGPDTEDISDEKLSSDEEGAQSKDVDKEDFLLDEVEFSESDDGDEYVEADEKPKKKRKAILDDKDSTKPKKKRRSDEKKEKSENRPKKALKDGDEFASKKRTLTDEERTVKKSEKKKKKEKNIEAGAEKRKVSSSSEDKPLTAAQRKKLLEENNAQEKNRINAMKNSSVPVWKQARESLTTTASSSTSLKNKNKSSGERPVETNLERALRLTKLVDKHLKAEEGKGDGQFDPTPIIRLMLKLKDIDLTVHEWAETKFIDMLNMLRKYTLSPEIASEAKKIRTFLKSKVTAAAKEDGTSSSLEGTLPSASDSVLPNRDEIDVSTRPSDIEVKNACPGIETGYHYRLALRMMTTCGEHEGDEQEIHQLPERLSNEDADLIVKFLLMIHNPLQIESNCNRFMTSVQKFSFELSKVENSVVLKRLRGLSSSDKGFEFIKKLAILEPAEWKSILDSD